MASHTNGRRMPEVAKTKIIQYAGQGLAHSTIVKLLSERENVHIHRTSVSRFLRRYKESHAIASVRLGSPKKIMPIHREFIDMWLHNDNELPILDIQKRLEDELGISVSLSSVRLIRKNLGWSTKRLQYCQLISHKIKGVRLEWCCQVLREKDIFKNVIFVDETTGEMSSCGRIFFHKKSSDIDVLPSRKPKSKHSYKVHVHVWGGISYSGRTDVSIFTGIMDSVTYQGILERNLLPFAQRVYPNGFRLYQDNDSKHNSKSTKEWMRAKGIADSVMTTPPSSPDLNPIENLWSAMKLHLCSKVKPRRKDELVAPFGNQ